MPDGVAVRQVSPPVVAQQVQQVGVREPPSEALVNDAGLSLDCQPQSEHLVGHRGHRLVGRGLRPLPCQRVGNRRLARVEVRDEPHDGVGCLDHGRETVHVCDVFVERALVAVADREVVGREVHCRKRKLHLRLSDAAAVARVTDKLYADGLRQHLAPRAVGVDGIRKLGGEVAPQPPLGQAVVVEDHVYASVVIEAVRADPSYT